MNRHISLIMALILCVFLAKCTHAESADDLDHDEESAVTIEITKLDVNDTTLELSYKIKNNTEHDVWICDDVDAYFASLDFEVYLSENEQTLLIRRRLDVPTIVYWPIWPYGRYVLLRSGQERTESLSLAVPVKPQRVFASKLATSDHARRLVLEIGFYNEDLPGMIREILEMAEKLNCARLEPSEYRTALVKRYFKGILIERIFGGLSGFEDFTYKEGSEEINIPYTEQNLNGEQVLRIEVDGIHIPYEELSAADGSANSEAEEADVTIELSKLEVTDANLDLSWKVKNNTDHDVWICDNIDTYYLSAFETFLAKDAETLIIRKRFDLPIYKGVIRELPLRGRYVRLHPGQERTESVSLTIPVGSYRVFEGEEVEQTNAEYARRLILEIGFYNEDLPGMILRIVELAEKLSCARGVLSDNDLEIYGRFFGGLRIASFFNSSSWSSFRESINEGGEEVLMPHMELVRMGEQVLRLTVDGVVIPYKGHYQPPLTGHGAKSTTDEHRQQTSSRNAEKPNREIASDRNGT